MKIIWLSPFPLDLLIKSGLKLIKQTNGHACSWIINWANYISKLDGVDLHIVTYSAKIKKNQIVKYNNYSVHVIKSSIWFSDKSWAGLFNIDAITKFFFLKNKFHQKLSTLNPDIIHAHGTEDVYSLVAAESNYKSVISMQGIIAEYLITNPCNRFKYTKKTEEISVKKGKYFMCRTHFDKNFVKKINSNAEIFHMPEPMNPCFFNIDRNEAQPLRIIHVGGFDPRKGLDDLFKSLKIVFMQFPNVKLDVIGSGTKIREVFLKDMAENLGISHNISWHGYLDAEEISQIHKNAALFIITSQNENSPNTLAEALCSGTPSIAYNVGGISSMFEDNKSGLLVIPGNINELAEKICLLLKDKKLREFLSNESIKITKCNHPREVARKSYDFYERIIND